GPDLAVTTTRDPLAMSKVGAGPAPATAAPLGGAAASRAPGSLQTEKPRRPEPARPQGTLGPWPTGAQLIPSRAPPVRTLGPPAAVLCRGRGNRERDRQPFGATLPRRRQH